MKFECLDCHKKFVYPTKKIEQLFPVEGAHYPTKIIEAHVCPYCESLNITEYIEPQPDITSVISIPIEDVDAKLKEGYVVRELYAKTATLIKQQVKEV